MNLPFTVPVVLAATLFAATAAAQQRGTFEAGLLVRGTLFDPSLEVATAVGFGGRLAVFLTPSWMLEADVSTSSVADLASLPEVRYQPFHVRGNFLKSYSARESMVIGLGLVTTNFGGDFEGSDVGLAALFGFRIGVRRSLVARVDGTLDYVPSPANGAGDNWNAGVQLGLGYRFGGP
jgi:outer membrane protein with beta-barrel domain